MKGQASKWFIAASIIVIAVALLAIGTMDLEKQIDSQEAYITKLERNLVNYQTQILELQQDKQELLRLLSESKLYEGELRQ